MPKKIEKLGVPKKSEPLRLKEIRIENYKGIDSLVVEFPQKRFEDDSDIVVIGSQNGLGKTSILECCSLLLYALSSRDFSNIKFLLQRLRLRLPFEKDFVVSARILFDGKEDCHSLLFKKGNFDVSNINNKMFKERQLRNNTENKYSSDSDIERLKNDIGSILGYDPNPILGTVFLHFNSYRKIQETAPEFGMLVGSRRDPFFSQRSVSSNHQLFQD